MSLTKVQHDLIQREYQETQNRNHRLLQQRKEEIFSSLPRYKKLSDEIASLSVKHARMLLDGQEDALDALKSEIAFLSAEKKKLLSSGGFSEDYLDPIYTCSACQDTGYIGSEKCRCLRQREIALLYEQSNIQELIERENFDTLSYTYYQGEDLKRFESAVAISKNFVAGFPKHYQNLFFYGTVGTGKSFLSGCVARELLAQGYSVIYFSANGLFEQLASYSFNTKMKESLYNFYKDLYNCDLVIIDDLGTEVTNSFVTSQLFGLLNERHLRQKATIISTNLGLEELRDRYSERVFSRITSNYSLCKLSGPDIRISKKLSGKLS
ncbi:MAG: ATP-binding protein [Lachnospiraceae bacterium]|nr:ATP-binding protein [Lachnospiraceae bacterium]